MSLRDRVPSVGLMRRMWIELVTEVDKKNRLSWLRHVLWKDDGDWVKRSMLYEVDVARGSVTLRMTWNQVVEKDICKIG